MAVPQGFRSLSTSDIASSTATIVTANTAEPDTDFGTDARAAERRTRERRLNDSALRAAVQASPLSLAASVMVLLAGAIASTKGQWHWVLLWIVTSCLAHALWVVVALKLRGRVRLPIQGRRLRGFLALSVGLGMGLLTLAPLFAPAEPERGLLMLLGSIAALTTAFALASMPTVATPAIAMPLLLGFQSHGSGTANWPFVVGSLVTATVAALIVVMRYREWRVNASLLIDHQEQLQTASTERDAAVGADNEKSRFLAIASHELRQPVHALGLFAGTLERRLQGSAEQPIMRNLIRAIEGLDRSFNTMLDISRLDAGSVQPNIQHFSLRDLFRRLHMYFGGQAELAGLGLRFSPGGKFVTSDPQLLERIVSNLIQNAVKYTESGGIVVIARSTRMFVNVEVWDTGIGIDQRNLLRVFDEFYQAGGSSGKAQGLGMGLAIVKRLCRRLGHELTIASRPGKGSMFRVGIPIGAITEVEESVTAVDTLPLPLPTTRTVLIVENEESIREGLRLLMEEWGYIAFGAASLSEGIDILGWLETRPDVIVSDLHLGDGPNGIMTINALRALCGQEIPAMLITGDTSYAALRTPAPGSMQVLFKPVQPRKLHAALRALLNR